VKICPLDGHPLDALLREAATMRSLKHPNLLPLLAAFVEGDALWLVLPLVDGGSVAAALARAASKRGGRPARARGVAGDETLLATLLRSALRGLAYLHAAGCLHRDLKAANLLLDGAGRVVLADFGVAATMERAAAGCCVATGGCEGEGGDGRAGGDAPLLLRSRSGAAGTAATSTYLARSTCVGTASYMAPEVMSEDGHAAAADVWSLGVTALELATGSPPWAGRSLVQIAMAVAHGAPPTLTGHCKAAGAPLPSAAACEFVAACLERDPAKRPTADALLGHRFLKLAQNDAYVASKLLGGVGSGPTLARTSSGGAAVGVPLSPTLAPGPAAAGGRSSREYHSLTWALPPEWGERESGAPVALSFRLTPWFGRATLHLAAGGRSVELLTRKYGLIAQLRFDHDSYEAAVPPGACAGARSGARVAVAVGVGLDFRLHGEASVDGVALPTPRYDFVKPGKSGGSSGALATSAGSAGSSSAGSIGPGHGSRGSLASLGGLLHSLPEEKNGLAGADGAPPPLALRPSPTAVLDAPRSSDWAGTDVTRSTAPGTPGAERPQSAGSGPFAAAARAARRALPSPRGAVPVPASTLATRSQMSRAFSTSGWSEGDGDGERRSSAPAADGLLATAAADGPDTEARWRVHVDGLLSSFDERERGWGAARAALVADAAAARADAAAAGAEVSALRERLERLEQENAALERCLGETSTAAAAL
jgi:serine/threonine-protein kinase OSR1/STK39